MKRVVFIGDKEYSIDSSGASQRPGEMIVYTTNGCVRCVMLKKWLKGRNMEFMEKNLDDVDVMADLIMRNKVIMSAPVLELAENLYTEAQIFSENGMISDHFIETLEEAK